MPTKSELEHEVEEYVALCDRQSDLLRGTANALHGGPHPKILYSHHDLPELAEQLWNLAAQMAERLSEMELDDDSALRAYWSWCESVAR